MQHHAANPNPKPNPNPSPSPNPNPNPSPNPSPNPALTLALTCQACAAVMQLHAAGDAAAIPEALGATKRLLDACGDDEAVPPPPPSPPSLALTFALALPPNPNPTPHPHCHLILMDPTPNLPLTRWRRVRSPRPSTRWLQSTGCRPCARRSAAWATPTRPSTTSSTTSSSGRCTASRRSKRGASMVHRWRRADRMASALQVRMMARAQAACGVVTAARVVQ